MLLRRRLVLLFAAILIGVLAVATAATVVIRQRDNTRVTERRLSVAREQVAQLSAAYADEETGARGFVLTGEERFLEPFNSGADRAERLSRSLRTISRHETVLREPLASVLSSGESWRTQAALFAIAGRRSGDVAGAVAAITGQGKQLFDRVRQGLDALTRRVDAAAAAAENRAATARSRITLIVLLVVVTAAVGALCASLFIRRWVTRPLSDLGEQVRRTRAGETRGAISVTGPPEIAALAEDVDAMRSRIEEQRTQAQRSRVAVEQSAAVLLTLRAHLEPDVGPLPRGWTLAAQLRAAVGVVAGDTYDIVYIDNDRVGLVVVDIAGHGAAEGILALRCKELLRASLSIGLEPGETIVAAADQLGELGEEVFLTAFVAVIDTRDGRVSYANAGHPPAFVATEESCVELGPTGPLVGLLPTGWQTAEAVIGSGDTLCVYTDGLIEVRGSAKEFFGSERLVDLVRGARCDEADAVVKRCLDEVQTFAPGGLSDDATIVVVCRPDAD
jgi:sigma-B regulation protein RsbU (phosphoserine phosphatase)